MPTQIYKTKDGKRVPSVTTITGRFKESGGLIWWAWDLGIQGIDYRKVRDSAADAGTLAHAMICEKHAGKETGIDDEGNVYAGTLDELKAKGFKVVS